MFDAALQVTQCRYNHLVFWTMSQWRCRACLREPKLPQLMPSWLSTLVSLNIKCTGWLVLFILQGKQTSCYADIPGWHSLRINVHSSNSLWSFFVIFPALWYQGQMACDCDPCPVYRTKKYILRRCFNHCIALMSCMQGTGPLTFFLSFKVRMCTYM